MQEQENFSKFFAIDEEKQERIITAAMKEFQAGYKKASTDNIVRDAGISKGLLFHYFGTKERLYNFLINHAVEVIKREYIDLINTYQVDLLDSIWQMSLLKQDLAVAHPGMFDFLTAAYLNEKKYGEIKSENLARFVNKQQEIMLNIYANMDKNLFREDINSQEAANIITWTLQGFANAKMSETDVSNPGEHARENYDKYLEEFQKILDVLRKCFYK